MSGGGTQSEPPAAAVIAIDGLRITGRRPGQPETVIVDDFDLSVARGEVVALIGESGSGKTTIALALLGHVRRNCRIAAGRVHVAGHDVTALDARSLRRLRGKTVAYVAQSAAASFNPARTIMSQVLEAARLHGTLSRADAQAKAVGLFQLLALPDPEGIGRRYPHEVSGGQLQRLLAAMALITDPELVIFDEPTTALDVTTQIEVLAAFKSVIRTLNITGIYVSHDLAVVAQVADRVVVLRHGRMQEAAPIARLLAAPAHPYSRALLDAAQPAAAEPAAASRPPLLDMPALDMPLLEVTGLVAGYGVPLVRIVDGVGLALRRGETLGVIGESGSGKSTLARAIAGLLPAAGGNVRLAGETLERDLARRTREQKRRVQMVFQNADTALNPRQPVSDILSRPLRLYRGLSGAAQTAETVRLLDMVRMPAALASRFPGEMSGGQKQRINLARALAAQPDVLLCDEIASALDAVVAASVLGLMAELQRELGLSCLFITHGLSSLRSVCDRVMVLYGGRTMEVMPREAMADADHHPYTTLLTGSMPALRPGWLEEIRLARSAGAVSVPPPPVPGPAAALPATCRFLPRCPQRLEPCLSLSPPLRRSTAGAEIFCHRD